MHKKKKSSGTITKVKIRMMIYENMGKFPEVYLNLPLFLENTNEFIFILIF
jgi:hypothetical protein